ncbi:MAG TPA: PQQ-dependent sugar dehydrogenase [Blastocatellia bacterium]|nr:PQQ-dependent sugar dehydrogenase [Blastocatellia bacterium]
MLRARFVFPLSLTLLFAFFLAAGSLPRAVRAQVLRTPDLAPGFDFDFFASSENVPEFAISGQTGSFSGPTAIAFDARGRLFVATGGGKVLILLDTNDDGRADQVKTFATGLPLPLGLAFRANGDLFVSSNINSGAGRIIRLRDTNGDDVADEQTIIVDNLPSSGDHQTDKIRFGPDGLLYIGQGSATDNGTPAPGRLAEGPLNGAILRVDVDNPQVTVYAGGLRQPFALAFHPINGELFSVDVGKGEFCNFCTDDPAPPEEINWIVQGGNYGFPLCDGLPTPANPNCSGVRAPLLQYPAHVTPTALAFYTGPQAAEFQNQMLVGIYKNYHNTENIGGDLRRVIVTGDGTSGFQLRDDGFIIKLNPIDPGDGPIDAAVDPISGDIYLARFDPVNHGAITQGHNHIIYRLHRTGSDALPFIGAPHPAAIKAGSAAITVSIIGRHLKAGAVVVNVTDNTTLATRQGADRFELLADLPASALTTERTLQLAVRNPEGTLSNTQPFSVTKGDPDPPPDPSPQITAVVVYKKKPANVQATIPAGSNPKKLRIVVTGTNFDSGAQLLVNGMALALDSATATELLGRFTRDMLAAPGDLNVQVKNATGKLSNVVKVSVVP